MKSKKFGDLSRYYWLGGIVIAGLVYATYSYTNTNNLPTNNNVQEEVVNNAVTEEVKETTKPKAPTGPIHIACATNDWDCFAKAATDKNTATMIVVQSRFMVPFVSEILDINTEFKITNVATNGDVTLSEMKTKVRLYRLEEYSEAELDNIRSFAQLDDDFEFPQITEEEYQESNSYWQEQVGLVRISVFTLDNFLNYLNQWKDTNWTWSSAGGPGQPYKIIKDEAADWYLDWINRHPSN